MRTVRAVTDKDTKYAGFDFAGKRRINGEVFEWPNGRGMPLVVRDEETGLIKSGWVELVSGEDEGVPVVAPKGRKKGTIPGLVEGKENTRHATGPKDLVAGGRASDRKIS